MFFNVFNIFVMGIILYIQKKFFSIVTFFKLIILISFVSTMAWICYANMFVVTIRLPFDEYAIYAPMFLFILTSYPVWYCFKFVWRLFNDFDFTAHNIKKKTEAEAAE